MELTNVDSSNIKAWGWEDEILEVEFVKGGRYRYTGVPREIWRLLSGATSKGKAFHRYIRPKQHTYEYEKVG